jgi:hypothetical protein
MNLPTPEECYAFWITCEICRKNSRKFSSSICHECSSRKGREMRKKMTVNLVMEEIKLSPIPANNGKMKEEKKNTFMGYSSFN